MSTQYRCAPVHTFPSAHEDVEDVARWLRENARDELGADPELLTVSGFSAGANLVLGVSQMEELCPPAKTAVKASVTFYAPVSKPKLFDILYILISNRSIFVSLLSKSLNLLNSLNLIRSPSFSST